MQRKKYCVFFGNHFCHFDDIKTHFPKICYLTQAHGNNIVEAKENPQEVADGHFSSKQNQTLLIQTADCMPVFFYNNRKVFALHIGWRGLAKKILTQASKDLIISENDELHIGPSIAQNSFELGVMETQILLKSHKLSLQEAIKLKIIKISSEQPNHYFFNLQMLLTREANSIGFKKISKNYANTFTSLNHYTYRRNRWKQGRNFSFIIHNL